MPACSDCRYENRLDARFCARCGAQLPEQPEEPERRAEAPADLEQARDAVAVPARATTSSSPQVSELDGYRSLGRRARWVQWAFIALIVASVVAIGFDGAEIGLMERAIAGEYVAQAELEASDSRQAAIALLVLAFWIVCAVVFIRWFHAAYKNMRAFGLDLRFKPGWSIGGWFVPILNFWRPKQIANDIWRGSDPALPTHLDPWSRPVPGLIGLWWAAWIIGLFVSRGAFRSGLSAETAEEFRTAAIVDIVGMAVDIAAAVLAILFVRRATARQAARAAKAEPIGAATPEPQSAS